MLSQGLPQPAPPCDVIPPFNNTTERNTMTTETEVKQRKPKTFRPPQRPDNPDIEGFVDSNGMARVLGCSVRTINNLMKRDETFPIVKVGRLNRFVVSDVIAHLTVDEEQK